MNGSYRRPQADIYTVLLVIALAAVILATIFAYLETADYGDQKYRGAPSVVQVDPTTDSAPWRLALAQPDTSLRPCVFATLR